MAARLKRSAHRGERGTVIVESLIALVVIGMMIVMVAGAVEGVQRRSLVARSIVVQGAIPRRVVLSYAVVPYTSLPSASTVLAPIVIDSTQVVITGGTRQDQLGRMPRVSFVMTDTRPSGGQRPDTLVLEMSPYLTRQAGYNLSDLRP